MREEILHVTWVEKNIYTIESDLEEGERKEIATGAQRRKHVAS